LGIRTPALSAVEIHEGAISTKAKAGGAMLSVGRNPEDATMTGLFAESAASEAKITLGAASNLDACEFSAENEAFKFRLGKLNADDTGLKLSTSVSSKNSSLHIGSKKVVDKTYSKQVGDKTYKGIFLETDEEKSKFYLGKRGDGDDDPKGILISTEGEAMLQAVRGLNLSAYGISDDDSGDWEGWNLSWNLFYLLLFVTQIWVDGLLTKTLDYTAGDYAAQSKKKKFAVRFLGIDDFSDIPGFLVSFLILLRDILPGKLFPAVCLSAPNAVSVFSELFPIGGLGVMGAGLYSLLGNNAFSWGGLTVASLLGGEMKGKDIGGGIDFTSLTGSLSGTSLFGSAIAGSVLGEFKARSGLAVTLRSGNKNLLSPSVVLGRPIATIYKGLPTDASITFLPGIVNVLAKNITINAAEGLKIRAPAVCIIANDFTEQSRLANLVPPLLEEDPDSESDNEIDLDSD
jgi:hypothetical protein